MDFVVASGPRTFPLHIDYTDRIIRPGDYIDIDINGNSYMGYKSCYYRTFICGEANEEQKEGFEVARKMMYDPDQAGQYHRRLPCRVAQGAGVLGL